MFLKYQTNFKEEIMIYFSYAYSHTVELMSSMTNLDNSLCKTWNVWQALVKWSMEIGMINYETHFSNSSTKHKLSRTISVYSQWVWFFLFVKNLQHAYIRLNGSRRACLPAKCTCNPFKFSSINNLNFLIILLRYKKILPLTPQCRIATGH